MGIEFTFDYSKAYPKAHNFAIKRLTEKFGPKGHCTLLDYIIFYGEGLKLFKEVEDDERTGH